MAEKRVVRTTFQVKRSTARKWYQINPILAQGEFGFEYDTGKLKIGNGTTPWRKLEYITGSSNGGNQGVYSAESALYFPEIGDSNTIYKASSERALYQYSATTNKYELICRFYEDDNDFSSAEKDKLASIEEGANKTVVDTEFSLESDNPIQNSTVAKAFNDIEERFNNLTFDGGEIV